MCVCIHTHIHTYLNAGNYFDCVVIFLSKDGATTFAKVSFGVWCNTMLAHFASHT